MTTVTLTSKNQLTLPAELVRQLGLTRNRKLRVERQGDTLMLTMQKDFDAQIDDIQQLAKPYVKRALSDAELKAARTEAWGARGKKLMR